MAYQTIFQRYELKYKLSPAQREAVCRKIEPYMELDAYGRTKIRSLYYDTADYRLIRHSLESPAYKEKLRLRSYGPASPESLVFVELKKKYRKVVYKRRIALPEQEAAAWIAGERPCRAACQIAKEIDYFLSFYGPLFPAVYLSYAREAFCAKDGSDFRVTFDDTILCRKEDLSLRAEPYGQALLPAGTSLMELKCSGGLPLWMAHILSEEKIYRTSFSKYGSAYRSILYPNLRKGDASCA